jgi:hypothetical protein
MQKEIKK